jgi:hypothetical protein
MLVGPGDPVLGLPTPCPPHPLRASSPLLAIKYQLVVVFMQAAATALAALLFVRLTAGRYLTPAHQFRRSLL